MVKTPDAHRPFTRLLLQWHHTENQRQMPWKGEKDPYRIWLSEVILQQTRVEQGWAYYLRFVEHYPTVARLAAAPEAAVMKLWEGLGYYSRCRNLMAAARQVMDEFGGIFPHTYPDIRRLKGVGPYTAAAIASFAFGLPHAVADGNVVRILARYFGLHTPPDTTAGKKEFAQLAQQLLPAKQAAAYNQAIMDFGATVCKPRQPACQQCPLATGCVAHTRHLTTQLPAKSKKLVRRQRFLHYFIISSSRGVLVQQRQGTDIWQGLHQFVLHEAAAEGPLPEPKALNIAARATGLTLHAAPMALPPARQQLTHQTIHFYWHHFACPNPAPVSGYQWASAIQLGKLAFPKSLAAAIRHWNRG